MSIESSRTPNGFDRIIRPDDKRFPIKLVNKTGHDLKFDKIEENVYFVYVDDPSDNDKATKKAEP